MYSFKKFFFESKENYDEIENSDRRKELIKHHTDMANFHAAKKAEHKKIKPGEKNSLEHAIAAKAHNDAGSYHTSTVTALENNFPGANENKIRANLMTKGANARSKLAFNDI
jgi:hypothetical protein